MARPIKETPILYSKDAKRFLKQMEIDKNVLISEEKKAEIKADFERINKITKP